MVNSVSNANRGRWIKDGRGADKEHQERPLKGKRTKAQLAASDDGMDHAINETPGAAAGGDQTDVFTMSIANNQTRVDVQHQERTRKRQKLEHFAFDDEGVGVDNAMGSIIGAHSLEQPEKSLEPRKLVVNSLPGKPDPDADIRELMHGELPVRSRTTVSTQDASVNHHRNADMQGDSESDNGSELSEAPALTMDITNSQTLVLGTSSVASNNKIDNPNHAFPTLKPQIHDAAYLESARVLASLRTGGTQE